MRRPCSKYIEDDSNYDTAEICAKVECDDNGLSDESSEPESNYTESSEGKKSKLPRKPVLRDLCWGDIEYAPEEGQRLEQRHWESGLQIIVKMALIELTSDKREFPVGGWHVEGQMNEHICSTSLY